MAVQGLVCGDCGQIVGAINVEAAREMALAAEQYVCRKCRQRRVTAFRLLLRCAPPARVIYKHVKMEVLLG